MKYSVEKLASALGLNSNPTGGTNSAFKPVKDFDDSYIPNKNNMEPNLSTAATQMTSVN